MMKIERYSRTAMFFHWLIALLIVANVLLIWTVDFLPEDIQRPAIDLHKSFGLTVLGLAIMRVLWRFTHPTPQLPSTYSALERFAAHAVHFALYALIFCLPLSGWAHDSAWKNADTHPLNLFGLVPFPRIGWLMSMNPDEKENWHQFLGEVHESFGYVLYAMFIAHVAGALKHQFFDKEPELQRMLPGKATKQPAE